MEKNNIKYFGFVSAIFVAIVFLLNYNHLNQQGTYENIFSQIALNLIDGDGYTCASLGNTPLLYPLWGYTGIVLLDLLFEFNSVLVLFLQYILCLVVINIFYKVYKLQPRYHHLLYFLPFVALMSVKWPDAIVGALLFLYGYFIIRSLLADSRQQTADGKREKGEGRREEYMREKTEDRSQKTEVRRQTSFDKLRMTPDDKLRKTEDRSQKTEVRSRKDVGRWKYMIFSGIVLGIILNFRTEYLLMPLVFLVFISFPQMKGKRKVLFQTTIISWLIAIILLLPWAFRAKSISGNLQFTATNSGAVM